VDHVAVPVTTQRIATVPNLLSLLRLLGVPVFLWLLIAERDGAAVAVLMLSGITDYLDGKLARSWNQISRVGQLLDPAADRLYILSTLLGLSVRGIIPWWLAAVLIARDLVLTVTLVVLRHHGFGPLQVHFLGKAATFNLLAAFPLLLLGDGTGPATTTALVFGWAFAGWGAGLYLWAGWLYVAQARQVISAAQGRAPAPQPPAPAPATQTSPSGEGGSRT
jgi:cardiolipin synthase